MKIAKGAAAAIVEGLAGLAASETAQAIVILTVATIILGKIADGEPTPGVLAKINQPSAGFGATITPEGQCKGSKKITKESVSYLT